jgi:hypothetical protein
MNRRLSGLSCTIIIPRAAMNRRLSGSSTTANQQPTTENQQPNNKIILYLCL